MNKHFLPLKETISEIIQRKRIQRGFTTEEVVEKIRYLDINMSKKTFERIENGNFYPTLEQFFMILKALNCSISIDGTELIENI